MYAKTTLESVQKYSSMFVNPSSSLRTLLTVTETTAAVSSSQGMVMSLIGATLDLLKPMHNEHVPLHQPVSDTNIGHNLAYRHQKSDEVLF